MVNTQLENWLKQGLKKGYSLNELKERALKHGYSENEFNEAVKKTKGKKSNLLKIILIIAVIAIVIIAAYFILGKSVLTAKSNPCANITDDLTEKFCSSLDTGEFTYFIESCMEQNPTFDEDACENIVYYDFAQFFKDKSFCERMTIEAGKKDCLEKLK